MFSYYTGAVIGITIDIWSTHDINLARQLSKYLEPGDILLGDRAFCAYSDICLWLKQGCDLVVRLHKTPMFLLKLDDSVCLLFYKLIAQDFSQ